MDNEFHSEMLDQYYCGTNWAIPAHIVRESDHNRFVRIDTLFQDVSPKGKPHLYALVMQMSSKSGGMIKTKQDSVGIVSDLCYILNSMDGVNVRAVIGTRNNSWVVINSETVGTEAFLNMEHVSSSRKGMGLIAFFAQDRTFLDKFDHPAPQLTPLVRCFEYMIPWSENGAHQGDDSYLGPGEGSITNDTALPTDDVFPWAKIINTKNDHPILYNVCNAICEYALTISMEQLKANAKRYFLMQKPGYAIGLVNFVSNEHVWIPLGHKYESDVEDKFTMMLCHAAQYNTCADEVTRRLLIFITKLYLIKDQESQECYMWLTEPAVQDKDSLTEAIQREKQVQQSQCYPMRTKENTILSIICTSQGQIYRALVSTDTHPIFGSAAAFRRYVNDNILEMLKVTASGEPGSIMRCLDLFENLSRFIVTDVRTYMTRCSWIADKVFFCVIGMYREKSQVIDLPIFLSYMHSTDMSVRVSADIVIMQNKVIFLKMPTESQCVAANVFHAVMGVDPMVAAKEISTRAFQLFHTRTVVCEQEAEQLACGHVEERQQTDELVHFSFPNNMQDADKETLYQLLRFKGLEHLLALSPLVPADQLWVGVISSDVDYDNIINLASKVHLLGMTQDLVVFAMENKLHVITMNRNADNSVGITLITAVANAYNTLLSNLVLPISYMKYTILDVITLFRVFNVGYRETKSGQKVINKDLLCKAMIHVLFGIHASRITSLITVWLEMVDFLLSGAISHRTHMDRKNSNTCANKMWDSLDTMKIIIHALYQGRVQVIEVLQGSIYIFQGTVSSVFMVAPALLEKHDHLIRNVELKGVQTYSATVGILASIITGSLYSEFEVQNLDDIYSAIAQRYQRPNTIPFIVRQILKVLWSEHRDYLYFPNVEWNSLKLISTWERNLTDTSLPFHHSLISTVLVDSPPKGSVTVKLDNTVSAMIYNTEQATVSMFLTDWPMIKTWGQYIHDIKVLSSALNTYKENAGSQPISSLLCFGQMLKDLWGHEEQRQNAGQTLLSDSLYFVYNSVVDIIKQITDQTHVTKDIIMKVLDKVFVDDGVSLVATDNSCRIQLLPNKEHSSVIVIGSYPFALLDQGIAFHFDNVSEQVELVGTIDNNLLLITDALMQAKDDVTVDFNAALKPDISDWLLACMQSIAVEKQRKVVFLLLTSMVSYAHLFWQENSEALKHSVMCALQQMPHGMVTTQSRKTFLQSIFIPFMEAINQQPDVGACVLLDSPHSCGYNILCTEHTVNVSPLYKGDKGSRAIELTEWLKTIKTFLQNNPIDLPIEVFVEESTKIGPSPIFSMAAEHVLHSIPTDVYTPHVHVSTKLIDTITRACVLNAWTRDIPAIKIYTQKHLIAFGQEMITGMYDSSFNL